MEAVVGIEVHAQLATRTKAFCGCVASGSSELAHGEPGPHSRGSSVLAHGEQPDDGPNRNVCPVCLGLPGALPVYNAHALRLAIAASLALGCTVHERSVFARKSYFYPDLPKGYQISQLSEPLATAGSVSFEVGGVRREVRIQRLHLEEDAGKLTHASNGETLVDLDRAGTPLAEIVSEPDLRSAAEAAQYLRELRERLLFVGACDGNLEAGNFRADVNVSIRPAGSTQLGTRVELKNLNSFRFVERAVTVEIERQKALLARGDRVVQETRGYDESSDTTVSLRSKEEADDYRYVPDPDLPILQAPAALVAEIRAAQPRLPHDLRAMYIESWGLNEQTARVVTQHPALVRLFEQVAGGPGALAVLTANFIAGEVVRDVQIAGLQARLPVTAAQLTELLVMVQGGELSLAQAKTLYATMRNLRLRAPASTLPAEGDAPNPEHVLMPRALAAKSGLSQLSDEAQLRAIVAEIVAANEANVQAYRAGKSKLFGFFVGKAMQATDKRANPEILNRLLREALDP